MCELFSPCYIARCSQDPKHHTLSCTSSWCGCVNPSFKNVMHLARCTAPSEMKFSRHVRVLDLEYDNCIFSPCASCIFSLVYHISLIVLCHFPLFQTFCPEVPFICHQDQLSIMQQPTPQSITWIFVLLATSIAVLETMNYVCSDLGNLLCVPIILRYC